jgi:hypothetical protein
MWSWTAVNYSLTVSLEVYFRGLIKEREESGRRRAMSDAALGRNAGNGSAQMPGAWNEKELPAPPKKPLPISGKGVRLVEDD